MANDILKSSTMMNSLVKPLRTLRNGIRHLQYALAIRRSENYVFLKFAPPGHFYSPLPDLKDISPRTGAELNISGDVLAGIDLNVAGQLQLVKQFAAYNCDLSFPDDKKSGARYYLDNSFFSYGDAVSLFGMLRLFKPKRIIEVGSGFSSALMLDINDRFFGGREIDFTFIEPYPTRLKSMLNATDAGACRIVEDRVQQVPRKMFATLAENDILFIDSSHVAKAGSDVLDIFFSILPMLRVGVLVHFHDILWPFEYPYLWLKQGRAWNEAYFVRAFLQDNEAFAIAFFNSYLELNHTATISEYLPVMLRHPKSKVTPGNTSLWLRKIR